MHNRSGDGVSCFEVRDVCYVMHGDPAGNRTDRWLPLMPGSGQFGGWTGWRGGVVTCDGRPVGGV